MAGLHPSNFFLFVLCAGSVVAGAAGVALADYRIRKDYGGFIDQYKPRSSRFNPPRGSRAST